MMNSREQWFHNYLKNRYPCDQISPWIYEEDAHVLCILEDVIWTLQQESKSNQNGYQLEFQYT